MNNPILAEIVRLCDDAHHIGTPRMLRDWQDLIDDHDDRLTQIRALAQKLDDQLGESTHD